MKQFVIESEYCTTWLEDEIVYGVFKPNLVITLDIAKQMVADRLTVSNAVTRPTLVDISGMISVETTARKFFASETAIRYINAGAIIVKGIIPKYAGNIYLNIDRPPIPSRIFNDVESAKWWLEKFKNVV